jgi:hypothetical protein
VTATTDRTDRHYLYRLGYHLQTRGLPDERIDDILAEARAHAAHSGESLREAFGAPRDYARRWDATPSPRRWVRSLLFAAVGAVGSGALTVGAVWLADGDAHGFSPVLLMILGTAVLVGAAAVIPLRALRDPVSACPPVPRRVAVLATLGMCLIIAGSGFLGALS